MSSELKKLVNSGHSQFHTSVDHPKSTEHLRVYMHNYLEMNQNVFLVVEIIKRQEYLSFGYL